MNSKRSLNLNSLIAILAAGGLNVQVIDEDTDFTKLPSLDEMLAGKRQRGVSIDGNQSRHEEIAENLELLEDTDFRAYAASRGVDLDVVTPGCECAMCEAITIRNNLKAGLDDRKDAATFVDMRMDAGAANGAYADPRPPLTVPEILRDGAKTYEGRNATYGNSYKEHGDLMCELFPNGIHLETPEEISRYAIVSTIASKLYRYSHGFKEGGHLDSIHDIMVYGAMLEELTKEGLNANR